MRIALHARYSTSAAPWHTWAFDQMDVRDGEMLLEVGAGTGALWDHNSHRLPRDVRLILSDVSPAMCSALRSLDVAGAEVIQADAAHLPLRDGTLDVVVADHMLYHVSPPEAGLAELARVLRPGGRIYAATNGRDHMREVEALAEQVGAPYAASRFHLPFLLEDAPARMQLLFREVEVVEFADSLEVTDSEPVADYLATVVSLSASQREAVTETVDREIDQRGAFHITKRAGMVGGFL